VGSAYYIAAAVFAVILWFSFRNKKITKRVALTVLLPYLFLVVISTVITRRVKAEQHFNLKPFWTIQTILSGGKEKAWLVKEAVLNILMLTPVGLLAPVLFQKRKIVRTLLLGIGISLLIEVLQLIMHRGLAEIDDIIFNTIGVVAGFGFYSIVKRRRNGAQQ
jgi:glycopeptide antibiotics resistance protein